MPPTTARRRWTVVLAVQLAAALLAAGTNAVSAADAGELVWLGEAGGQTEARWTTDPSVRPWRDADGNPAAYQDGRPVVMDERAASRAVVVADPDGVSPASVRFSHRTGRYTLDALGPGVTGLTTLTVEGDGELELRNANGYAGPVSPVSLAVGVWTATSAMNVCSTMMLSTAGPIYRSESLRCLAGFAPSPRRL